MLKLDEEKKRFIEAIGNPSRLKILLVYYHTNSEYFKNQHRRPIMKAIIISIKADLFGKEWIGHEVDESFVTHLCRLKSKSNINLCGE
jgi:diphthamide synthase (EF-2-diphthine--ammonia ligase)